MTAVKKELLVLYRQFIIYRSGKRAYYRSDDAIRKIVFARDKIFK